MGYKTLFWLGYILLTKCSSAVFYLKTMCFSTFLGEMLTIAWLKIGLFVLGFVIPTSWYVRGSFKLAVMNKSFSAAVLFLYNVEYILIKHYNVLHYVSYALPICYQLFFSWPATWLLLFESWGDLHYSPSPSESFYGTTHEEIAQNIFRVYNLNPYEGIDLTKLTSWEQGHVKGHVENLIKITMDENTYTVEQKAVWVNYPSKCSSTYIAPLPKFERITVKLT